MRERGSDIVPYYNGEMDYWNTKPPLINWLQILSMKIFGINEFAIRFPSALAGLFTVLFLYWFLKKHFNSITGFVGSCVLLTSVGFVSFHGTRTGDTDALLTFFMTVSYLIILDIFISQSVDRKKIMILTASFIFGFLAKSIAVFLFLPGVFIFGWMFERAFFIQILKRKSIWISVVVVCSVVVGFILLRNSLQPGYSDLFFRSDLGRVGTTIEKHEGPFWFYIDQLVNKRYSFWILFFVLSILFLFAKNKNEKSALVLRYTSSLSIFYLVFISISVTKLEWYDLPLFPLFALSISVFFYVLLEKISLTGIKTVIAFLVLFFVPYKHVFGLSQTNHYTSFEMQNEIKERYLKANFSVYPLSSEYKCTIYHDNYLRSLEFYQKAYHARIKIKLTDKPDFLTNEVVWISDDHLKNKFETFYEFEITDQFDNLTIYRVKGRAKQTNSTN